MSLAITSLNGGLSTKSIAIRISRSEDYATPDMYSSFPPKTVKSWGVNWIFKELPPTVIRDILEAEFTESEDAMNTAVIEVSNHNFKYTHNPQWNRLFTLDSVVHISFSDTLSGEEIHFDGIVKAILPRFSEDGMPRLQISAIETSVLLRQHTPFLAPTDKANPKANKVWNIPVKYGDDGGAADTYVVPGLKGNSFVLSDADAERYTEYSQLCGLPGIMPGNFKAKVGPVKLSKKRNLKKPATRYGVKDCDIVKAICERNINYASWGGEKVAYQGKLPGNILGGYVIADTYFKSDIAEYDTPDTLLDKSAEIQEANETDMEIIFKLARRNDFIVWVKDCILYFLPKTYTPDNAITIPYRVTDNTGKEKIKPLVISASFQSKVTPSLQPNFTPAFITRQNTIASLANLSLAKYTKLAEPDKDVPGLAPVIKVREP